MQPFAITNILAATDLSDSSVPALRYARAFADRFEATLTILYADPILAGSNFPTLGEPAFITSTPEDRQRLRDDIAKQAAGIAGVRPYEIEVTPGQAVPSILSAAEHHKADLIVTGTHLRHGWRRAILGSVSDGVIHGSRCPVLTVAMRDHRFTPEMHTITNILCPVNFTDVAREAVRAAAYLAEGFGAHLTIVHVLEPDEITNVTVDEENVRQWVAPELQDAVSYRELVVRGGPAERVLDCADDIGADLLVIGAQHKLFRDATVIGTTSERLIRFAACPVLVVPRAVARREARSEAPELVASIW